MPNLEDAKRAAQNAVYTAAGAAQDAAATIKDSAVTGVSLVTEKRSLEKNYQALGEWYAAQCGDSAPDAVSDVVRAIRASQSKIAELRARGETEE